MMRYLSIPFLFLLASTAHAGALLPWTPTPLEMRALPPFCVAKMNSKPGEAEYETWNRIIGPNFLHIHHYCAALNFVNRAYSARSAADRRFNLSSAIDNFGYMITHASPDFSMMPEIYVNRGRALMMANNPGEAMSDFEKAISLNPKLPQAYNAMADFYMDTKNRTKALELITEGLRQVPTNRGLQHRYDELGGKKPYPEPYAQPKPETEPDAAPAPEAQQDKKDADGLSAADIKAKGTRTSATESSASPKDDSRAADNTVTKPKNRWCRFCPDDDSASDPPPSTPAAASKEKP